MSDHEKPISLKTHEVLAILDGRKTMVRHVITSARTLNGAGGAPMTLKGAILKEALLEAADFHNVTENIWEWSAKAFDYQIADRTRWLCRVGHAPGDHLWVQETWQTHCDQDRIKPRDLPVGSAVQYPATYDGWVGKKRPSMFMPRWASRITLRVTGVKVERLQDISEEDAKAEGAYEDNEDCDHPRHTCEEVKCIGRDWKGYRTGFANIWHEINSNDSWSSNPWVMAYTFERMRT